MLSRKRHDILSQLGKWGPWGMIEEARERKGGGKKNIKTKSLAENIYIFYFYLTKILHNNT